MQKNIFIPEISRKFSSDEVKELAYSLSHDLLIWEEVNSKNLWGKFENKADLRCSDFRPGNMALFAMDLDTTVEQLSKLPLVTLPKNTRVSAIALFEETIQKQRQPLTLEEAGLLALALRERRRVVHSWEGLTAELKQTVNGQSINPAVWKTPFTCLFSLIPDGLELLKELVRDNDWDQFFPVVSHVLLTNPMTKDERIAFFGQLLKEISIEIQVEWLRQLRLSGEKTLAQQLAIELISLFQNQASEAGLDKLPTVHEKVKRINFLENLSSLYHYAGKDDLFQETVKDINKDLEGVRDLLDQRLFEAKILDSDLASIKKDLQTRLHQESSGKGSSPEISFLLSGILDAEDFSWYTSDHENDVLRNLARVNRHAKIGYKNDDRVQMANDIEMVIKTIEQDNTNSFLGNVSDWNAAGLVDSLNTLDLDSTALKIGKVLQQKRPSDIHLIGALSRINEKTGQFDDAIDYTKLAIALEPDSIELHRNIAYLWEKKREWINAFDEWNRVLQLGEDQETNDWLSYGKAAAMSNQPHHAIDAYQKVLDGDGENETAHLFMAEALVDVGKPAEAIDHLERPSLMVGNKPEPWLLLSKAYSMTGKKEKGKEILKLGVSALPDSAELNNALAKAIVNDGKPDDAVPYFWRAKELAPDSDQMLLDLGRTLRMVGRQEDAICLLNEAMQKSPGNIQIGYLLAESLIDLGREVESLPILEAVISSGEKSFEKLMLYVDVLLGFENRGFFEHDIPSIQALKALDAVNSALEINPDNIKARITRAELLAYTGDGKEALSEYKAINSEFILDRMEKELESRFFSGYGLTALKAGDSLLAIDQLNKAVERYPENLYLLQQLAEAYYANDLRTEGFDIARRAIDKKPGDLENVAWFVDKANLMEEYDIAEEALTHAVELTPTDPKLWLKLAEFQNGRKETQKIKDALDKVLSFQVTDIQDLRKAARMYYGINENTLALVCLEKAQQQNREPSPELMIEVACANIAADNLEIALQILQEAADLFTGDCRFNTFASDILGYFKRFTSALSCLEKAVDLVENDSNKVKENVENLVLPRNIPDQWLASLSEKTPVFLRYAYYLRRSGDLVSARNYLKNALDDDPGNIAIRYSLADLHRALLENNEAEELSDCSLIMPSQRENTGLLKSTFSWQKDVYSNINCLHGEIALQMNLEETARQVYKNLSESMVDSPRIYALGSRLLHRDGQVNEACRGLENALNVIGGDEGGSFLFSSGWPFFESAEFTFSGEYYWIVQAALENKNWYSAVKYGQQLVDTTPDEPMSQYLFSKILTIQAEQQRLSEELHCINNCPGSEVLSDENYEKFVESINKAKSSAVIENSEIERLRIRGQAVFRPTEKNIQEFLKHENCAEDAAIIMMLARQRDLGDDVIQESWKTSSSKAIQAQLALSLKGEDAKNTQWLVKKASDISTIDPLYLTAFSILAENNGDYSLAYQFIEKALGIWSDEPEWHAKAGRLAARTGQRELQTSHWKTACLLDPQKVEYLNSYGEVLLETGKILEASNHLLKANEVEPDNVTTLNLLSKAFTWQNQLDRALDWCERIIKTDPENLDAIMAAGETALKMHNLDKAFEYAKTYVKLDPKNPRGMQLLAHTLVDQGKAEDALTVLDHAVNMVGSDPAVLFDRAKLINNVKGSQVALSYLEDLAKVDPEDIDVLTYLAKTQIDCKQNDQANETLHQALRISPTNPQINLMIGRLQKAQGQLDQAVYYLSEAVRTSPINVEPYIELATTYQERKEYQQALDLFQKAIKLSPMDDRAYYQSAIIMREIKDFQGAEAMLRKAAQISPNDLSIRRQLSAVIALNLVHNASEANIKL